MKDYQKYLILRYATIIEKDCIKKHQEILESEGYCWFGKIGNVPSKKILDAVFEEETPTLVLYKKGAAFICELISCSPNKQSKAYPAYYDSEKIYPSIYFKLKSITKCDDNLFHDSIVVSTGNFAEDALYHSRIPFMLAQYIDENKHEPLGIDDCRYLKASFCTYRTCVNFDCICQRPSSCIKQRR